MLPGETGEKPLDMRSRVEILQGHPQGKLVSSRNSTRHGLFAETIVLEAENTGRFFELVESLYQEQKSPSDRQISRSDHAQTKPDAVSIP